MKKQDENGEKNIRQENTKLPEKIKIGYQDVSIKFLNSQEERLLEDNQGFYDGKKSEIAINASLCTRERINTVIHECLHAVYYTYGMCEILTDKDKEEYTCNNIANALTQIFRDNPLLLDWIKSNI